MDMYNDLDNDKDLNDNSNFDNSYNDDYDFIQDYEDMMKEIDEQDPIDIIPDIDQNTDFYEAIDNWDNYYYEEDISEKIIKKGKRTYNNCKEDENEFKKEFKEELSMLYDLLDESNKFGKKLTKKYDSIDGSKAKGTSKYLNDLIASILASNTNKLQIIKEINSLKKTIQELKIKADGKKANVDTESLEGQANSFFRDIMSVGRNNFVSALNNDPDTQITYEYSLDDDIEYANALPDAQAALHDRINERLENEAGTSRSAEADKYIIYENLKPELIVLYNNLDNSWEIIAVDKDGQRINDYPVPTRGELGKVKFSQDGRFMTDGYGRSYKCIDRYGA